MSKSATATWLVSVAATSADLEGVLEALAVGQAGEGVEVIAAPALLPLVLGDAAEALDLGPRPRELPGGLGEADEALGADGADVPVEGPLKKVGRSRFEGGLGLALAGAQGEEGNPRATLLAEHFAEAAAPVVADDHVGDDDGGPLAARAPGGRRRRRWPRRPRTPRWPATVEALFWVEVSRARHQGDAPLVRVRAGRPRQAGIEGRDRWHCQVRLESDSWYPLS